MDRRKLELARFTEAIELLRREFPTLQIDVRQEQPDLEAVAKIPAQPGLDFEVEINLQNRDELHLSASSFWVEWFPCGDASVFERFMEAAKGLISGRFRILESRVGRMPVQADLQRPTDAGQWLSVATWCNLGVLIPWRKHRLIVQNRPGT